MNVQTFLSSGLLESYALGQCSAEERQLVEKMLREHESVRQELAAIELALEQYAQSHAVQPPEWLKGRILDTVAREASSGGTPPPRNPWNNVFTWALWAVCFALGAFIWSQNRRYERLQAEQNTLRQQITDCAADRAALELLTHPATRQMRIEWIDPTLVNAGGTAIAFHNPELKATYLQATGLPAIGPDQDYQLWAITESAPLPQPLPVFSNSRLLKVPYMDEVKQFAISIEPKGGSPNGQPTRVVGLVL